MRVISDIEANGIYPTKIWCVVCYDPDAKEWHRFVEDEVYTEFPKFAEKVEKWIGHNFINYDAFWLNTLVGTHIHLSSIVDTLVLSRLFDPIRKKKHSLEAWGERVGYAKQKHSEWDKYSPEMLERCEKDVRITLKTYNVLTSEGQRFSQQSIDLEHKVTALLEKQKRKGFFLNVPKASSIFGEINDRIAVIEKTIDEQIPLQVKLVKEVIPKFRKDGQRSLVGLNEYRDRLDEVGGPFSRIAFEPFNMGSNKQIIRLLDRYGWKPIERTKTGQSWKVASIANLATVPASAPEVVKMIPEYFMLTDRRGVIKQWFDALDDDNRVHGSVISCGAITHRMSHNTPNMANIPAIKNRSGELQPYGREMRSCWTVPDVDKYSLVGVDAASIQLRILAHYMNDPDYTNEVVHGKIHAKNAEAAGGIEYEQAKTFIYAWLLGAGDRKLGEIVGGNSKDGELLRNTFLSNTPALKRLKLESIRAAKRGYLVGLDGRRIAIKSPHYALSVYLQGGEATIMKQAYVFSAVRAKKLNLDGCVVAIIHDEFQNEVLTEHAVRYGDMQVQCIKDAGKLFNTNCPMDGSAKIGTTWADTH